MERNVYDLKSDPFHDLYRGLVDFALQTCPLGLLVLRPDTELTEEGLSFLASLRPFVESEERSDRWPGTELLWDAATLFYFRLEPGSARLLKAATDPLYGGGPPAPSGPITGSRRPSASSAPTASPGWARARMRRTASSSSPNGRCASSATR